MVDGVRCETARQLDAADKATQQAQVKAEAAQSEIAQLRQQLVRNQLILKCVGSPLSGRWGVRVRVQPLSIGLC